MYKITNLINGKIYVGVHRTKDLDDGYMGSGQAIKAAIQKYGRNSFKKEIVEYFNSIDEMFTREAEIVSREFVLRQDTYNLCEGGGPVANGRYTGQMTVQNKTGLYAEGVLERAIEARKQWQIDHKEEADFYQRRAVEAARTPKVNQKRKETFKVIGHQQGKKNSQFGKMWITNEIESMLIGRDDPIPEGWRKGRVINK